MLITVLLLMSIALQIAAAFLALRLARVARMGWPWLSIAAAVTLMALRRGMTLAAHLGEGEASLPVTPEITALVISALLVAGLASVGPRFRAFGEAGEALRATERRLSTLLQNMPGMAYRCRNDEDWTFEYASPGTYDLLGYQPSALVDNREVSYNEVIAPEHRQSVHQEVERALAERRPFRLVYRVRTANGMDKWVWEQGVGVLGPDGRLEALEGLVTDISERQQAEEVLRREQEQLEQRVESRTAELAQTNACLQETLAKLERSNRDLQQFAYSASHDLQEPLRMLNSFLQALDDSAGPRLDDSSRTFIRLSLDSARRMQQLINDLLAFARVGAWAAHHEPVAMNELVDRVIDDLQGLAQSTGGRVTREDLPVVRGDGALLGQLLQNLIGNGLKFHGERPSCVQVSAESREGEWVFAVRDTGIGIDPRHLDRIFVIFERLHGEEQYPGTGIGLAICKRVVEHHGGRLWVESEPGRGSVFFFTLPRAGEPQS